MFRGMARGLQYLYLHVFNFECVTFHKSFVFEGTFAGLWRIYSCACSLSQIHMTGDKVSMQMSLQNMRNSHPHVLCRLHVNIDVSTRINNRTGV